MEASVAECGGVSHGKLTKSEDAKYKFKSKARSYPTQAKGQLGNRATCTGRARSVMYAMTVYARTEDFGDFIFEYGPADVGL